MRITPPRLELDTDTDEVIVTKADGVTEIVVGGSPGGSDTQVQYNDGGDFNGNAGLVIHEGTSRPDMPNGWRVTVSGNTGTFTMTPTGARTVTFQDATHTVVGRDTTDMLTNKTIVAANNTITDTGSASGDILVHNGTRFVRLAKGANGTFLGVTGGVVGYYSTGAGGSPGGSNTQIQFNDAGAFNGASITTTGNQLTFGSSGYIEVNTTPATGGYFRCGTAAADILTVRNSSNTANLPVASHDGSNFLKLGSNVAGTAQWSNVDVLSSSTTRIGGSSIGLTFTSSEIAVSLPRHGNSTPYASEGEATISTAGPRTVLAAEYSRACILFTTGAGGGTHTFPAPAGADQAYIKCIRATGQSSAVTLSIGSGATVVHPINTSATYLFNASGVFRIGAAA